MASKRLASCLAANRKHRLPAVEKMSVEMVRLHISILLSIISTVLVRYKVIASESGVIY